MHEKFAPKLTMETACTLVRFHRDADVATTTAKFFPWAIPNTVALLEATSAAPTINELYVFLFDANPGANVMFNYALILVSPEEWDSILAGNLPLPPGWDLGSAIDL